jgi:hypothetical protein
VGLRRGWEAVHALGPKNVASRAATLVLLMIASDARASHDRFGLPPPRKPGGAHPDGSPGTRPDGGTLFVRHPRSPRPGTRRGRARVCGLR